MQRKNSKHMRFKGYADGGKVMKSEYGEPTFMKSVAAKVGVGDGYSYSPKKSPDKKRMSISNATQEMGGVVAKRKKMLDDV